MTVKSNRYLVHTNNGKILMKNKANGDGKQQSKSEDKKKLLRIETLDKLHKYSVNIDFAVHCK